VLRGLGWKLLRVWSTDWFQDAAEETRKLVDRIEALRSQISGGPTTEEFVFSTVDAEPTGNDDPTSNDEIRVPMHDQELALSDLNANKSFQANSGVLDDSSFSVARLSRRDAIDLLRALRDDEIATSVPDWEPERSILRDGMIETFVSKRVADPDQWFLHVPQYLRQNTNKIEKDRFLDRICEIVGRIEDN
jgi:hypothetical protein